MNYSQPLLSLQSQARAVCLDAWPSVKSDSTSWMLNSFSHAMFRTKPLNIDEAARNEFLSTETKNGHLKEHLLTDLIDPKGSR